MKGNKILVAAISIITVIGCISGLVSVIKSNKKKNDRNKTLNKNTPQTLDNTVEEKETKIDLSSVNKLKVPEGILEVEYESAEQLLKDVLVYLLNNSVYRSPEELLEQVIRLCGQKIEDFTWYEHLPKNIGDLESKIENLGLYEFYERNFTR